MFAVGSTSKHTTSCAAVVYPTEPAQQRSSGSRWQRWEQKNESDEVMVVNLHGWVDAGITAVVTTACACYFAIIF